ASPCTTPTPTWSGSPRRFAAFRGDSEGARRGLAHGTSTPARSVPFAPFWPARHVPAAAPTPRPRGPPRRARGDPLRRRHLVPVRGALRSAPRARAVLADSALEPGAPGLAVREVGGGGLRRRRRGPDLHRGHVCRHRARHARVRRGWGAA